MDKVRFIDLIDNYVTGTLTKEEWMQLRKALEDPENLAYLDEELLLTFMNDTYTFEEPAALRAAITEKILQKIKRLNENNHLSEHPMVVSKRTFVRSWQWAAAVLFAMLLSGGAWWLLQKKEVKNNLISQQTMDVLPGKNGAVLKLSDGSELVLDSLAEGVVTVQHGTRVTLNHGQLVYDAKGHTSGEVIYNTMSTPKGRQFQLVLPDGTKVWLNAASSITYPASFSGKSRDVKITGEAYFEVAKMKEMPFMVKIADKGSVKVLGTHFNINAYDEEKVIKTTLLEGSVEASTLRGNIVDKQIILKPGQQAKIGSGGNLELQEDVNTDQVMAWKNGLFNFDNAGLEEIMRQLSRWYDIEVVYEKDIPHMSFGGEISRNISLSGLLSGLERVGVHFRIEEGRRLVVMP